jgi:ABC-type glycerol-3-phosphate transport system substrate-binding protein
MKGIKKTALTVVSALICAALLASCGTETVEKPGQNAQITIKIGMWPSESSQSDREIYKKWQEEFNKKYPGINLIPEPYDYDPKTFIAKAESGQLPNLFATWYTEPDKIIKSGYAADITGIVRELGYDNAYDPEVFRICMKDGKVYALPRDMYKLGLWCNVELFKQAGLVDAEGVPLFPKTFDEMAQKAKTIKDKTGKDGFFLPTKDHCGGWHFNNIAWNFGAEPESLVDGKWTATFNSRETVDALQYVKDLKWKYNVLSDNILLGWADFLKNYGTNQAAMVIAAIDQVNAPVENYGMSKDNFAICSMPEGPGGKFSQLGGNVIMFSKSSTAEQIDACMKWLEMTELSPKINEQSIEDKLRTSNETGKIVLPFNTGVWTSPERIETEQKLRDKYTNVNPALSRDYFENKEVKIKPEAPYNCQDLYGVLDNLIQKVLSDKNADPKSLLDTAAKEFQKDYLDSVN